MSISLENAIRGRGGRIEYIYHVSGYPWAVATSSDVVTALNAGTTMAKAARARLFGFTEYDEDILAEDQTLCQIFPTLQQPGSQTIQADESKGLSVGGWDVKIADIEPGFDWAHTNGDIWGLDGLHRVAQPRVDSSIYWGILEDHLQVGDNTFTVEEAQGTNLHTKIQAADDGIFLWIGQECLYVTDSSNSSGVTTITIPNSGSEGRGCFRSREQNFFLESYGNAAAIVTDAPMSIIDKPCWLWAVLFDENGNMLLDMTGSTIDNGMVLIRHGKVSSGIETKKGITRVKCHGALKALDNDVKISHFAGGQLSNYFLYRNELSGTELDYGSESSSVMKYMQAPHMIIEEYASAGDTEGTTQCIWIGENEEDSQFYTVRDLIDALNEELSKCSSKDVGANDDHYEDQYSGDTNTVNAENERTDLAYNYVVSYDGAVTQTQKTGGAVVYKPSCITGVLPWLLNLGGIFKRLKPGATIPEVEDLKAEAVEVVETLKGGQRADFFCYAFGSKTHWRVCQCPGFIGYAWRGVFLKPWDAWVSPYYYEYGNDNPEMVATWDGHDRGNLAQSTFPLLSSDGELLLTPDTDTSGLGSGDLLTLGGQYTLGGNKKIAQATVISVSSFSIYPVIAVTGSELVSTGQEPNPFRFGAGLYYFPAIYSDLEYDVDITNNNRGSIEQTMDGWTGDLIDNTDPWAITTVFDGNSQTLSPIFKALLGGDGITVHENYIMRHIVGFVEEGSDFKSTIDWDCLDDIIEPICTGHNYSLVLDKTVNLYELLVQECLFHGLVPTWEWSVENYQFVMRFRRIGPVNITDALWSGRAIKEEHISLGYSPSESHNDSWLYNKMSIKCNYENGEPKTDFAVEYNSGHVANRESSKTLNINSKLSQLPGLTNDNTSTDVRNHFVDGMLIHLAEAAPTQRTQTNITRLFDISAGKEFVMSDRSAHKPYSHELGLSSQPAWATRIKYDLDRLRMSITYRLTDNVSYGWAPALQIPASASSVESGYIQCSPSAHTFSSSNDRLDVSWFDCLDYNQSNGIYSARDCSCGNYAVYAFDPEQATIVLQSFTAQNISTSGNTIRLYGTTSGWTTTNRYIVIFQEIDHCEECQTKFVFMADSNNTLADGSLPSRWI